MAKVVAPKTVTLIKLGGSVVTDKSRNRHYRREMVQQLGRELAEYQKKTQEVFFIGHGQGSFGHTIVKKYADHFTTRSAFKAQKMAEMLRTVSQLHELILDDLIECGLPVISYRFSQQAILDDQGNIQMKMELLDSLFDLQTIPLTTGDIVVDERKGNAVLSTEKIFFRLIKYLHQSSVYQVKRVVYVTEVEGVLDHDKQLIPHIGADQKIQESLFFSESGQSDVTGAMKHKVESAQAVAKQGIPVAILSPTNLGNLTNYLNEKTWRGTLIDLAQ